MSSQKINLLAVSTSKNTDQILDVLQSNFGNDIGLVFHVGSKRSDLKGSSFAKMVAQGTNKNPRHPLADSKFQGIAHQVMEAGDFEEQFALFVEHLTRAGIWGRFRANKLQSIHDYYDYFHILLDFFAEQIQSKQVTHALFFDIPHLTYDTVIYQLCKAFDIPIVIFNQSLIPNTFFSLNDIDDYGHFEVTGKTKKMVKIEQKDDNWFYMQSVKQGENSTGRLSLKGMVNIAFHLVKNRPLCSLNPFCIAGYYKKAAEIARSMPSWRDPFGRFFNDSYFDYFYEMAAIENLALDFDKTKFVYFPLHLQPEMTTSSLGRVYRDQALAIEKLAKILPNDVKIFVKENPKQGAYMRGPMFFHRLRRMQNVKLVPSYTSTHELLAKCEFLATITGTAGWEAIKKGKKALVFGNAWYRSLPGTVQFQKGLSYAEIIHYQFTHEQLEQAYSELIERAHTGIVSRHYQPLVEDFNQHNNDQQVAEVIHQLLTSQLSFTFQ